MPRTTLLTVPKAAEHMGVTRSHVYQQIRSGAIKAHRVPAQGRYPERLYVTKREADKHTKENRAAARAERRALSQKAADYQARLSAADQAAAHEGWAEDWVDKQLKNGW